MNEAASPALRLENIARRYGEGETVVEVLNGAELTLWPGQSVALIAPSGAGKSTLLHIAGLLEKPSEGEVHVGGAPTAAMSDDQRTALRRGEIGFVYQFHHLLPEFSALENIMLPQMIRGFSRAEAARRASELLALSRAGLEGKTPPRRTLRRRTTARRHSESRRQRPAPAARRRAHRQPRPENRGPRLRHPDGPGPGQPRRGAGRDSQSGAGGKDGSAGDVEGGAGGGDGVRGARSTCLVGTELALMEVSRALRNKRQNPQKG